MDTPKIPRRGNIVRRPLITAIRNLQHDFDTASEDWKNPLEDLQQVIKEIPSDELVTLSHSGVLTVNEEIVTDTVHELTAGDLNPDPRFDHSLTVREVQATPSETSPLRSPCTRRHKKSRDTSGFPRDTEEVLLTDENIRRRRMPHCGGYKTQSPTESGTPTPRLTNRRTELRPIATAAHRYDQFVTPTAHEQYDLTGVTDYIGIKKSPAPMQRPGSEPGSSRSTMAKKSARLYVSETPRLDWGVPYHRVKETSPLLFPFSLSLSSNKFPKRPEISLGSRRPLNAHQLVPSSWKVPSPTSPWNATGTYENTEMTFISGSDSSDVDYDDEVPTTIITPTQTPPSDFSCYSDEEVSISPGSPCGMMFDSEEVPLLYSDFGSQHAIESPLPPHMFPGENPELAFSRSLPQCREAGHKAPGRRCQTMRT